MKRMNGDQAVKWSAVAVVVAVAGIAAVVSYNHALALVTAHGEAGIVAYLVPLTVDGLIYAASMALLSAARWPTGCSGSASPPRCAPTWPTG